MGCECVGGWGVEGKVDCGHQWSGSDLNAIAFGKPNAWVKRNRV